MKLKGGTGALLQASIGTSDKGYIFAVDSTGTAYPIANANKETLKRLGYAKNDVQAIPRAWIDLFSKASNYQPSSRIRSRKQPIQRIANKRWRQCVVINRRYDH